MAMKMGWNTGQAQDLPLQNKKNNIQSRQTPPPFNQAEKL